MATRKKPVTDARPRRKAPQRQAAPTPVASPELTPREARRDRRRDRSREEILAAARKVLLKGGISALTLDAVAAEVGVSKTAIYYYFESKDALVFELVFRTVEAQSRAVHEAVGQAKDGGDALRAIIRETVRSLATHLDDFRLAFMHGQVAGPGAVKIDEAQLQRLRPLNELAFAGAAKLLGEERRRRASRARVEPRLMAFLANMAAIGLLTMKGMVESVGDPLLYSDEQLIEGFARIFEAAAAP
jgi:AcrR family transcriptional regulator